MGSSANDQSNLTKIPKQGGRAQWRAFEETNLNKCLIVRLDLCLGRIKQCNVRLIYNIQLFFSRLCHYISYLTCHIISSHLRTNSINSSSNSEDKQAALVASTHSKRSGGDVRMFTLSESSRYVQNGSDPFRHVILAQQRRRNGTETWRRRSCLCEHLHLITHEKILLNGDVPRRNGNVTYSVNRSNVRNADLRPHSLFPFAMTLIVNQ
jgi:hypothetical protein